MEAMNRKNETMSARRRTKAMFMASARAELDEFRWSSYVSDEPRLQDCMSMPAKLDAFLSDPTTDPVGGIIVAMHKANHRLRSTLIRGSQAARGKDDGDTVRRLDGLHTTVNDISYALLGIIAQADGRKPDCGRTLADMGAFLLGGRVKGLPLERPEAFTMVPFPWDEEDARKVALAIPEAAKTSIDPLLAELDDFTDQNRRDRSVPLDDGDALTVLPIAVSKGFDPAQPLTAATVDTMFALRGDWRPEIAEAVASPDGRRLLSYMETVPASSAADWILAIISHISDDSIGRSSAITGWDGLREIINTHCNVRRSYRFNSMNNDEQGLHSRAHDVSMLYKTEQSHGRDVKRLIPAGDERNPAAIETVLRLLDSMSIDDEISIVNNLANLRGGRKKTPIRIFGEAVSDLSQGLPVSYVRENMLMRMDEAGIRP